MNCVAERVSMLESFLGVAGTLNELLHFRALSALCWLLSSCLIACQKDYLQSFGLTWCSARYVVKAVA